MPFVSLLVAYDDRWYFSELIRGVQRQLEAASAEVHLSVVGPTDAAIETLTQVIERDFADSDCIGAIVAGVKYRADQRERILSWRRPVVLIGGSVLGFPTVMIDDINASRTATEHLVRLGHRRIAHFTGILADQMAFHVDGRRAKGYATVMDQAGLAPLVIENEFDHDEVHRQALEILRRPDRPTAIFATSDEIALPILDAARALGLEPGSDLSVIGIDDHPAAAAADLSTVRQRPDEIGSAAAEMLLEGLNHGPDPSKSRLHATSLISRGSTRPPRAAWSAARTAVAEVQD